MRFVALMALTPLRNQDAGAACGERPALSQPYRAPKQRARLFQTERALNC